MRRLIAALAVAIAATACVAAGAATVSASASRTPAATAPVATVNPGIGHVFLIVLENRSYRDAYVTNPNPYLGHTLQQEGTLLTHYYGIGHFSLDNYLALISGQAPNPKTSSDCVRRTNFTPAGRHLTINRHGQAVGKGCVYPAAVKTLADQLSAHGVTWGGFMQDLGAKPGREQAQCGVPHLLAHKTDDTQSATKTDQYAARHNPFVYFKSLLHSGRCKQNVANLDALRTDLGSVDTTPAFSFITPNLCNDGHDAPCRGTNTDGTHKGGLVAVDGFLKTWIPLIQASPAYQQDGVIIVTADESDGSDSSSCCHEKPGPTEAKPGLAGPGGGRIGTLVIGKCVAAGAQDPTPYNHYSLLRSLEDLYGITDGGTDGAGHLGYAAAAGLRPFGRDVFNGCAST